MSGRARMYLPEHPYHIVQRGNNNQNKTIRDRLDFPGFSVFGSGPFEMTAI
jgi:hypothetical protein